MASNGQNALGGISPKDLAKRRLENLVLYGIAEDPDLSNLGQGPALAGICKEENRRVNLFEQNKLADGMENAIKEFDIKEMLDHIEVVVMAVENIQNDPKSLIAVAQHIGLMDEKNKDKINFDGMQPDQIKQAIVEKLRRRMLQRIHSIQVLKIFLEMDNLHPNDEDYKRKLSTLISDLRLAIEGNFTEQNGYSANDEIGTILPRFKSIYPNLPKRKDFLRRIYEAAIERDSGVDQTLIDFMKNLKEPNNLLSKVNPFFSRNAIESPILIALGIQSNLPEVVIDATDRTFKLRGGKDITQYFIEKINNFLRKDPKDQNKNELHGHTQEDLINLFGSLDEDLTNAAAEDLFQMTRQRVYNEAFSEVSDPKSALLARSLEKKLAPVMAIFRKQVDKYKDNFIKKYFTLHLARQAMLDMIENFYPDMTAFEKRTMRVIAEKYYQSEYKNIKKDTPDYEVNKSKYKEMEDKVNAIFKEKKLQRTRNRGNAVDQPVRSRRNAIDQMVEANEKNLKEAPRCLRAYEKLLKAGNDFADVKSDFEQIILDFGISFSNANNTSSPESFRIKAIKMQKARANLVEYCESRKKEKPESLPGLSVAEPRSRPSSPSGLMYSHAQSQSTMSISSHISGTLIDDKSWEKLKVHFVNVVGKSNNKLSVKVESPEATPEIIHVHLGQIYTKLENRHGELEVSSGKPSPQMHDPDYEDMALRFRQAAEVTKHTACVLHNVRDPDILSTLVNALLREDDVYTGLPKILPNLVEEQKKLLKGTAAEYSYNEAIKNLTATQGTSAIQSPH